MTENVAPNLITPTKVLKKQQNENFRSPATVELEQQLSHAVQILTKHVENVSSQLHFAEDKINESVQQGIATIQRQIIASNHNTPVKSLNPTEKQSPKSKSPAQLGGQINTSTLDPFVHSADVGIKSNLKQLDLTSSQNQLIEQLIYTSLVDRITKIYHNSAI